MTSIFYFLKFKNMKILKVLFLIQLFSFCMISCGEPEEEVNEVLPFELVGTWDFVRVSANGTVNGLPSSDVDEDPQGTVEFNADGNGYSDITINLLGFDIGTPQPIQWERIDENTIDIEEEDGVHQIWNLIKTDSTSIEAIWALSFSSLNKADITMNLVKI